MKIRNAIGLIMLTAALLAVYELCVLPYRLNAAKRSIEAATLSAVSRDEPSRSAAVAHRNLATLKRFQACCDTDLDLHIERAASLLLLNRHEEAVEEYEQALKIDRRPEIYFNLGLTEVMVGRRDEGTMHLVKAIRFDPNAGVIPDPILSQKVHSIVLGLTPEPDRAAPR